MVLQVEGTAMNLLTLCRLTARTCMKELFLCLSEIEFNGFFVSNSNLNNLILYDPPCIFMHYYATILYMEID